MDTKRLGMSDHEPNAELPPKRVQLRKMYGSSYFGSGGAYGKVVLVNAKVTSQKDNGFIRGPDEIEVVDPELPASVVAKGGDCIGEGRTWGETYDWTPGVGWRSRPKTS